MDLRQAPAPDPARYHSRPLRPPARHASHVHTHQPQRMRSAGAHSLCPPSLLPPFLLRSRRPRRFRQGSGSPVSPARQQDSPRNGGKQPPGAQGIRAEDAGMGGRTETGLPRETQARHQSQARRAPVARAERTAQHLQEPADDRPLQLRRDRNHLQHHRDRLLHRCPGNGLRQACLRTAYDLPPRSRGTELQDRRPPHSHPAPPHGHLHGRYPATAGQLRLIEGRRYVQPSGPAHGKG